MLLDRGIDPDRQGKKGNSALNLAVKSGGLRMVELVPGYGPDLSVRNWGNLTPMGLADRLGFRDIKARLEQATGVVTR